MDERTPKERLIEFIETYCTGQTEFVNNIHASISYVRNFTGKPTKNIMDRIREAYPQLNMNWVLTGEGSMLNDSKYIHIVNNSRNNTYGNYSGNTAGSSIVIAPNDNSEMLKEKIKYLEEELDKAKKEIDRLMGWNERLLQKIYEQ